EGLHVDEERMRANLELTDGAVMAERLSFLLSAELGRPEAQAILEAAARSGRPLREALAADPRVSDRLAPDRLDDAFDPAGYLGSAEAFVDRALALYHSERGGTGSPATVSTAARTRTRPCSCSPTPSAPRSICGSRR